MSVQEKIDDALKILSAAGINLGELSERRRHRLALALLALSDIQPDSLWANAAVWGWSQHNLTTRQTITFWNEHYGEHLSSGSYDDVRRRDFVFLREAGLAIPSAGKPDANTNNPTRAWAIAPAASDLIRKFGTAD